MSDLIWDEDMVKLSSRWTEIMREPNSDMDRVLMGKTRHLDEVQETKHINDIQVMHLYSQVVVMI